jgi:hypothetical protein
MSWRKQIKLQGLSRSWRVFIVQFERTWRRGIMRALRSSDGDGRKECSAAASERWPGTMQRERGDGREPMQPKRQWRTDGRTDGRTAECSGAATDERMSSARQKWWGFTAKYRVRARCSTGWYRSVWARGAMERTRAGVVEHAVVLWRVCVAMYSKHCRHTPMAKSASFVRDSTSLLVPNASLLFSIVLNQFPQAAPLPTLLSFCPEAQFILIFKIFFFVAKLAIIHTKL